MTAPRLPDWPARLGAVVQQRLDQPFAWGTNDCASFAADCVLAVRGVDLLAELRGPRTTPSEARRQLQARRGVRVLDHRLARWLPSLAQRGDILLLRQWPCPVLAVCLGEDAVAPGEHGLRRARSEEAQRAWKV